MSSLQFHSPAAIQDYLDSISFNFEKAGETCMSPVRVEREKKAHCIEGAMFAAKHLELLGYRPLILNLKVSTTDVDHVVALFKHDDLWGAISKTNHNVLRYRDPIYSSIRELAMSYFHEYFLVADGTKTMHGYSRAINLNHFGHTWKNREDDMWDIARYIYDAPITRVVPHGYTKFLRKASLTERKASALPEWPASTK